MGERTRVQLPAGVGSHFQVFVNGVPQQEGTDYEVHEGGLAFSKPLEKERIGVARWTAIFFGLFGSYGKNETVDVHFRRHGKIEVVSNAKILPG